MLGRQDVVSLRSNIHTEITEGRGLEVIDLASFETALLASETVKDAHEDNTKNVAVMVSGFDETTTFTPNPGYKRRTPRKASPAPTVPDAPCKQPDDVEQRSSAPTRQQWSNPIEFLMSCIAMSVGLGNVWRFPFTAFENGGGAFLIPYIIVLVIVGKPLYYMELALGQFCSAGPVKVWEVVPALRGVGVGQMISVSAVTTYYCSLMAITMYYFLASFTSQLPWARCDPTWLNCFDGFANNISTNESRSPAEIYYMEKVMKLTPNLDEGLGVPEWRLSLCLLFSYITIFLVLLKGVKSSGKAAYFLAIFPYVVLVILLVRGALLPGAVDGILYFITPQWDQLRNPQVWYAAVTQSFFSLQIGFGGLIMYSSYSTLHHNVHRDALIVSTVDTLTSVLAGLAVFAILGSLAHERGTTVDKVVQGGSGLAFIAYPETISKFNTLPQVFALLFFLMMYTLGVGSAVGLVGTLVTVYCDQFPTHRRWVVTLVTCTVGFFIGLIYLTPGGEYILELVDHYSGNFIIFILATIEIIGISWIYGLDNFCRDVEFMLGWRPSVYWLLCWGFVTPVFLIVLLVYRLALLKPLTYNAGYLYPDICYALGWSLFFAGLVQVVIWGVFSYCRLNKTQPCKEALKAMFRPSKHWGPKDTLAKQEWQQMSKAENCLVRAVRCATRKMSPRPR